MHARTGHETIVWHDLFTNNIDRATSFYFELLGWEYQVEHAPDSVWVDGEADYPLIFENGEAHGGFVNPGQAIDSHWRAYVQVDDVDEVTNHANKLGSFIERSPFDAAGVGRSSVIRDLQGSVICPFDPVHRFPPPSGTFIWDELITTDIQSGETFYADLFRWKALEKPNGADGYRTVFENQNGIVTAGITSLNQLAITSKPAWLPYIATSNIAGKTIKAKRLGATLLMEKLELGGTGSVAVLVDPTGAMFGLLEQE